MSPAYIQCLYIVKVTYALRRIDGLPRPSQLQFHPTHGHPYIRAAGQRRLYGLLPDRPLLGLWHQDGAVLGLGHCRSLGHLRRHLLHNVE